MDTDISLGQQAPIAVITVFALDYLKRADWFFPSWFNQNSEKINRAVSLLVALATATGLKVLSGNATQGWVIAIPPLAVIMDTLMHTATQFGGQELLHKLLGNHVMSKQMLDQITEIEKRLPPKEKTNA